MNVEASRTSPYLHPAVRGGVGARAPQPTPPADFAHRTESILRPGPVRPHAPHETAIGGGYGPPSRGKGQQTGAADAQPPPQLLAARFDRQPLGPDQIAGSDRVDISTWMGATDDAPRGPRSQFSTDALPRGLRQIAEIQAMVHPEVMARGGRLDLMA